LILMFWAVPVDLNVLGSSTGMNEHQFMYFGK
jgi:hypothetical protein